jgi:hypothetical protein
MFGAKSLVRNGSSVSSAGRCVTSFKVMPAEVGIYSEIGDECISTTTKFVFDHEIISKPGDFFQLLDGQWFLVRYGVATLIEGKWDRI